MPWSETTKMRERMRFVLDAEGELFTMTELCERYGISRMTGHKWLRRFRRDGVRALEDRWRAPLHCPHQTDPDAVGALVEARHEHPYWGARKLILWLAKRQPGLRLPAASTAGDILKRLGLDKDRRRRRHIPHLGPPTTEGAYPNQLWSADFKGQFKTRDAIYCYPLTVADSFSRYLLGCRSQLTTATIPTKKNFQRIFRAYGLPEAIRTDNGNPFSCATAISRLSRLSVWWIRLGIRWKKGWVNISTSIIEQNVGLEEVDDGVWSLYFGSVLLGRFHEDDLTLHGARLN